MNTSEHSHICPNCESEMGAGNYCPECGQKRHKKKLRLSTIIGEIFAILFNIDNQLFKTIKAALIPSKLATEYIKGKRKSYLNPLRFFFYSWLLFALVSSFNTSLENPIPTKQKSLLDKICEDNNGVNKFNISIFTGTQHHLLITGDSLQMAQSKEKVKAIDIVDIKNTPTDSIFQKYAVTRWQDRFAIERVKRLNTNYNGIWQSLFSNAMWVFLFVIPFSALWLFLLFGRQKKYYVEHILYLLYLFSVLFVFFTFALLVARLPSPFGGIGVVATVVGLPIYSYKSMKRYYGQGTFLTLIKWLATLVINFMIFLFFSAFYTMLSISLF